MEWNKSLYISIPVSKLVIPQLTYKKADPRRINPEDKPPNEKEIRPARVDPLEWNRLLYIPILFSEYVI